MLDRIACELGRSRRVAPAADVERVRRIAGACEVLGKRVTGDRKIEARAAEPGTVDEQHGCLVASVIATSRTAIAIPGSLVTFMLLRTSSARVAVAGARLAHPTIASRASRIMRET